MILKVYSVRDSKGEVFNTPYLQKTHGEAERSFKMGVNDPGNLPYKFPEDYDLYYLGEFDDKEGKYKLLDSPQHLVKAIQVKETNGAGIPSVPGSR